MAAPSKSWTDILNSKIDADSPVLEELMTWIRDNIEHVDERIGIPVDSGDRQASHRHRGLGVDGSDFIELTPQENLIVGGDGLGGFSEGANVPAGDISFRSESPVLTPRNIRRSGGGAGYNKLAVYKSLVSPKNKIKSSGGKGRFTCSGFVKRLASASGVVGGTLRFGLWDGTAFVTGAFADIDFDDVTTEYKRFYLITNQIARPTALNLRFEWTADPSDWDIVSNDDVIGYLGGAMVTNGPGLAKWGISHLDGGGDDYLSSPDADEIYWWDEIITVVQESV